MRRKISLSLVLTLMMLVLAAGAVFTGCGKEKAGSGQPGGDAESAEAGNTAEAGKSTIQPDITVSAGEEEQQARTEPEADTPEKDADTPDEADTLPDNADTPPDEADAAKNDALTPQDGADTAPEEAGAADAVDTKAADTAADEKKEVKPAHIIWIGDSLTQGSLGDMDDNLEHAPYVRLQKLCADRGDVVEGFGYYAYVTSDIFWKYDEFYPNGDPEDPENVYVLWVGSNDFALSPDPLSAVPGVTAQIDKFVGGGIDKYIVLSHLPRAETVNGGIYSDINAALKEKYGERFLDITSCAPYPDGFQSDQVHLTQKSYNRVADAVYDKLIRMGYI